MKKWSITLFLFVTTILLPTICSAEIYSPTIKVNGKNADFWGKFYTSTLDESGTLYITSICNEIEVFSGTPFSKINIREVIDWDILSEPIYTMNLGTQSATYSYYIGLDWNDDAIQFTPQRFYAIEFYYKDDLVGLTFFTDYGKPAGQFYYLYNTRTNSATVSGINVNVMPTDLHCEIPSTIDLISGTQSRRFDVTAIRSDVNLSHYRYQSLTIPNSITEIGGNVFKGMKYLKEVSFSDGETPIAIGCNTSDRDGVFISPFADSPLEKVYMGRQYQSASSLSGMKLSAFAAQTMLKEIEFGNFVTYLPYYCLEGCSNLTSVKLPNNLTSILQGAFYGCSSIEKIVLPSGLKSIGMYAFTDCKALKALIMPESITELGTNSNGTVNLNSVFSGCSSLKEIICLYPKSVGYPKVGDNTKILTPNAKDYGWGEDIVVLKKSDYEYSGETPVFDFQPQYSTETSELYQLSYHTNPINTNSCINVDSYTANCEITLSSLNGEYGYTLPFSFTVSPAPLAISAVSCSREYGTPNPSISLEYSGFKNNETDAVLTEKPKIVINATEESNVGSYAIEVSDAEARNYKISYIPGTLTIVKASQCIQWDQEFGYVVAGDQIELNAQASSGLNINYEVSDHDVATIDGNIITFNTWGCVTVKATQPGNMNYLEAKPVEKTITIDHLTGIDDISDKRNIGFSIDKHILTIYEDIREPISIFSLSGNLIYHGYETEIYLHEGFYIVIINGTAYEIMSTV